eukprot:Gregarina_sp_Pseudo_9__5326@NODE_627_length_2468_cov_359_621655_g591_i0_p2_GENE_NODE_627_length_2468_cov_359_621655_g591_i0NODE_627_length_2468_cov_359_621655_g591_i0_p2_ORF_typecomplete_len200_score15_96_NODE_627_length_2468_cov_359_621655_g591_i031630
MAPLEGGTFIVPATPLAASLMDTGAPSLVVSDADFISLFPKVRHNAQDSHFVQLPPCVPGVWTSVLFNHTTLICVSLTAVEDADEEAWRALNWKPLLDQLPWKPLKESLQVDHGNLFVFPSFSFPNTPPDSWFSHWINRCFDLTVNQPLDVTGDVSGPVGSIWRLPEGVSEVNDLKIATNPSTGDVVAVQLHVDATFDD